MGRDCAGAVVDVRSATVRLRQILSRVKGQLRTLPNVGKVACAEGGAREIRALLSACPACLRYLKGRSRAEARRLALSPKSFLACVDGEWRAWEQVRAKEECREVVVALTSYGWRVAKVHMVIESLLRQTLCPGRVVLYFARSEFPDVSALPGALRGLLGGRFGVRFVEDLKSHKKYFYAFREFPEAIVVTVDDDVRYPSTLLARLMAAYHRWPHAVICARSHTLCFEVGGNYAGYRAWMGMPKIFNRPSSLVIPTGVGGVLYPPHCFGPALFAWATIRATCLSADDLWLKWHALERGVPSVCVPDAWEDRYVEGSQEDTLCAVNVGVAPGETQNDVCWGRIQAARVPQCTWIRVALADEYVRMCMGGGIVPLGDSARLRHPRFCEAVWIRLHVVLGAGETFRESSWPLVG